MVTKNIGVLALQGGFDAHIEALRRIDGVNALRINSKKGLESIDGLIIPGGESSTFLKLLETSFKAELLNKIKNNFPIFGTCAGLILLAKNVENPSQESLNALDIDVRRNAYGRQLESFETDNVIWEKNKKSIGMNSIFIRAPKITRVGKEVEIIASYNNDPVLVKSKNILGATFHPELTKDSNIIHKLFIDLV